jgi:hypothetical protein
MERSVDNCLDFAVTVCDMHAVGQQSTVETLFITVAKQRINTQQWKRPASSMGSDPSLHATVEGTVVFYGVCSEATANATMGVFFVVCSRAI